MAIGATISRSAFDQFSVYESICTPSRPKESDSISGMAQHLLENIGDIGTGDDASRLAVSFVDATPIEGSPGLADTSEMSRNGAKQQ